MVDLGHIIGQPPANAVDLARKEIGAIVAKYKVVLVPTLHMEGGNMLHTIQVFPAKPQVPNPSPARETAPAPAPTKPEVETPKPTETSEKGTEANPENPEGTEGTKEGKGTEEKPALNEDEIKKPKEEDKIK